MGILNKRSSFGPPSLFSKVSPAEKKEFLDHLKSDTRTGIQIGAALVIVLFSTFMVIDPYILPSRFVGFFRVIRMMTCIIDALIIIALRKGYFQKYLELIGLYVCLSVGLAIVAMVQVSGGATSPYYAGISLTIVGFGVAIPWQLRYSAITCGVLYLSYLASSLYLSDVQQMSVFINNNGFLITNIVMSLTMTQISYKFRLNKFLSDKTILKANEDLKELDKAKSAFFSNVSHELKTPMTLVLTPLEYALDKAGQEAEQITLSRKSFNAIRHSAFRLAGLISDLLDLTKGQIGKDRIKPVTIHDTEGFFRDIFQSLAPLMDEKKIQHEFYRSPKQLQPHLFDRTKIDKVVVNLLSNAIKFTPKGGKIEMRIWDEEKSESAAPVLKLSVADSGIGIPQEKISKVFERFVQVDDSSTRGYAGLGIGLSLVKDFVEQHGGSIDVESRVGFGTTMIITLPRGRENFRCTVVEDEGSDIGRGIELPTAPKAYMAAESGATEEKKEEIPKEKDKDTILVVDDTVDMRVTLKEILGDRFRVVTAEDGVEGYKVAKAEQPDLIISDVMMPRRDGYGLILDIRSDPRLRATPVILLTAKVGAENRADGFQHGADDYIEKPFHPKEIVFRVENLLRLNRRGRQSSDPARSP